MKPQLIKDIAYKRKHYEEQRSFFLTRKRRSGINLSMNVVLVLTQHRQSHKKIFRTNS